MSATNFQRFFALGCSFTKYRWPTWSDIIAHDLKIPYLNAGHSGAGNFYILYKLLELDNIYKFTPQDLIVVGWSSWHREDRLDRTGVWKLQGRVSEKNWFPIKYWSEHNDVFKNWTAIMSANKSFKINFQFHLQDYQGNNHIDGTFSQEIVEQYKDLFEYLPQKHLFETFTPYEDNDGHPDIKSHVAQAKLIYKNLGLEMKPLTEELYAKYHTARKKMDVHTEISFPQNHIPISG